MVEGKIHPIPPVTTPRLAPWDHVEALCNKLDRLIALMEAWAPTAPPPTAPPPAPPPTAPPPAPPPEWPGWQPVISKLDEIKSQLAELEIKVTAPWVAKETEEIFRRAITTAGTFYSDKMVNWTEGKRLLLKVTSSLDQAVQIQAIGNINNAKDGATDINAPKPCAAGGRISIGLAWDDWHPYIGCEITIAVAPTAGTLVISAVVQE
ncbi:MAG: hypothetical protein JRE40_10440 [Deltaproteobacteria bacterium]|nr:hypothetical protein [Deltaproteobacteria bacterium]